MTDRCHRIRRMKGARKGRHVLDMFVTVPHWHGVPQGIEKHLYRSAAQAQEQAERMTRANDVYQYKAMTYREALVGPTRLRIRIPILVDLGKALSQ
jgi:hypothetical protein